MANTIKIGNIEASAIKIGTSNVSAAYIGSTKIYPSAPPPTDNWVFVDDWGIQSPRKIKVDYSLIVDTEDFQEDYQFYNSDLGTYSILYLNDPTATFLMENYGIEYDFIMEHFQMVVVFDSSIGDITDVLEPDVEYSTINGYSLTDFSVKALNENRYLYATE